VLLRVTQGLRNRRSAILDVSRPESVRTPRTSRDAMTLISTAGSVKISAIVIAASAARMSTAKGFSSRLAVRRAPDMQLRAAVIGKAK